MKFDITPEMIEAIPESERGPWLEHLERHERGLAEMRRLEEEGKFHEALGFYESQERAGALVRWADRLDDDEVAELLAAWWSSTEAWGGSAELRKGMYALLRRAGTIYVGSDDEEKHGDLFGDEAVCAIAELGDEDGNLTIYRGNAGENPRHGHAWTLSKETAEFFSRMPWSLRGTIVFGITPPEDGVPTIWRATVAADAVLAYFDDRGETEVVVDPDTLRDIEKIGEAR